MVYIGGEGNFRSFVCPVSWWFNAFLQVFWRSQFATSKTIGNSPAYTYNKRMLMKRPLLSISIVLALIIALIGPFSAHSENFYPAKVKDISDRGYDAAARKVLDNAKESIVISMYILVPSEKGPISFLIEDLAQALDRGVSVTIYLNTKFGDWMNPPTLEEKPFRMLIEKGAEIFPVTSKKLLHDKLVIVDSRFVIEGSTNWSTTAMKSNFESSTLIDSPQLAEEKLGRLKELPLESERIARIDALQNFKNAYSQPPETKVKVKKALLEDKNLFPEMVRTDDKRTMTTYLLLLAKSQSLPGKSGGEEFPVFLEELTDELEVPKSWIGSSRKQKTTKALRRLQDKYNLIDVKFQRGREAWVALKDPGGDTFPVDRDFFSPSNLSSMLTRTKFVYLMRALLHSEETSLDSFTSLELSERFHMGIKGLRKGRRELEGRGDGK